MVQLGYSTLDMISTWISLLNVQILSNWSITIHLDYHCFYRIISTSICRDLLNYKYNSNLNE